MCQNRVFSFNKCLLFIPKGSLMIPSRAKWKNAGIQYVGVGICFWASEDRVVAAGSMDTVRSIAFTGRPARVMKTPYVMSWERRLEEMLGTPLGTPPHRNSEFLRIARYFWANGIKCDSIVKVNTQYWNRFNNYVFYVLMAYLMTNHLYLFELLHQKKRGYF